MASPATVFANNNINRKTLGIKPKEDNSQFEEGNWNTQSQEEKKKQKELDKKKLKKKSEVTEDEQDMASVTA